MKARCIRTDKCHRATVTVGKIYDAEYDIEGMLSVEDDDTDGPYLYPEDWFEIVHGQEDTTS